jgi:hypothetical protein
VKNKIRKDGKMLPRVLIIEQKEFTKYLSFPAPAGPRVFFSQNNYEE